MYGVENRFKMQLFLGLKGSPLVGVRIVNFVPPEANCTKPMMQRGMRTQVVLRSLVRRFTVEPFKEYGKNSFTGSKSLFL